MIFNKRGQITVFVIIAIVIVLLIAGYFVFRSGVFKIIPSSINPAYTYYISCIEQITRNGVSIMGSQAGWIYTPDFSAGSEYAPFSSHLAFMGIGVPYWYYVSGNGIKEENIPTLNEMNNQLAKYVREEVNRSCDFSGFVSQGFLIEVEDASSAKANIQDSKININLNQRIVISKGEDSYSVNSHKISITSDIGRFYNLARKVYDFEKKSSFLENYSRDVLYNYAPVDGVVLNCSPTIWSPFEVIDKLKKALNANIGMLKLNGDYYNLKNNEASYFVIGKNNEFNLKNERINFMYSPSWASRFEVWPTKKNLMMANPVGAQQGLSALGFCYAPYKFVYDLYFPVLIQIYDSNMREIFQFPVAVIIDKNVPREAIESEYINDSQNLCDSSNTPIVIKTYNNQLEAIEADMKFKCLNSVCALGKTKIDNSTNLASLEVKVPQCYNGVLISNAKDYSETKYTISTNEENSADIILQKEYKFPLEIYVDGALTNENAVLLINEVDGNQTTFLDSINYPLTREIKLSQGVYNFELKVYKNGNIIIPATNNKQCLNQPKEGILGFFGVEEEKCYDVNLPSQTLTNLIYAGGNSNGAYTEDMLSGAETFRIDATSVKLPSNLEEIQTSSDSVENKKMIVSLV